MQEYELKQSELAFERFRGYKRRILVLGICGSGKNTVIQQIGVGKGNSGNKFFEIMFKHQIITINGSSCDVGTYQIQSPGELDSLLKVCPLSDDINAAALLLIDVSIPSKVLSQWMLWESSIHSLLEKGIPVLLVASKVDVLLEDPTKVFIRKFERIISFLKAKCQSKRMGITCMRMCSGQLVNIKPLGVHLVQLLTQNGRQLRLKAPHDIDLFMPYWHQGVQFALTPFCENCSNESFRMYFEDENDRHYHHDEKQSSLFSPRPFELIFSPSSSPEQVPFEIIDSPIDISFEMRRIASEHINSIRMLSAHSAETMNQILKLLHYMSLQMN